MTSKVDLYSTCPYRDIEPARRWDQAVAKVPTQDVDPGIIGCAPTIKPDTRVGTAGSCFAQRIAETLRGVGYNFVDVEPAPKWLPKDQHAAYNYGIYSARCGNIYTVLQLVQLLERSLGIFAASDDVWGEEGRYLDPFRPRNTPDGYASLPELLMDRKSHLNAVQQMFRQLDVFVFTMGLTEAWIRADDGAALPVCPGCGVGVFDENRYIFQNFDVDQVCSHLNRFLELVRTINPDLSIILTVSPVPLAATMEEHNVLLSSTYSKSVLRVAAQMLTKQWPNVCYFPSYEIVTHTLNSAYFGRDRRNITGDGVAHVMRCFFRSFADVEFGDLTQVEEAATQAVASPVLCDEEELALALASRHLKSVS